MTNQVLTKVLFLIFMYISVFFLLLMIAVALIILMVLQHMYTMFSRDQYAFIMITGVPCSEAIVLNST